jgi:hypothetical protein
MEINSCNSWVQHILELKNNCSKKILAKIENDISSSVSGMMDPNNNEKSLISIQKSIMNEDNNNSRMKESLLENQFAEFKRQTKEVLEKEEIYEKKLEEQEKERLETEESQIQKSVKAQQMMAAQLITDMQNLATADSKYKIKEISIKREMKNMMEDIENTIMEKRQKLLNKIQRMRTLHELSQKKTGRQLIEMKREMGKKLNLISKKGNPSQCFVKDQYSINNYCMMNFEDYDMQTECKKEKQFCYICCDNEIGQMKKENLECCYNKCDEINSNSSCMIFEQSFIPIMPVGVVATPNIIRVDPSFNTV